MWLRATEERWKREGEVGRDAEEVQVGSRRGASAAQSKM